jgi:hypothetical protein
MKLIAHSAFCLIEITKEPLQLGMFIYVLYSIRAGTIHRFSLKCTRILIFIRSVCNLQQACHRFAHDRIQ